jgi:sarcosine oxidase
VTEFVDTIVAGGGTAGSAAAWQLARRGAEVLLLEAEAEVADAPERAFELAFADPVHQAIAAESVGLWAELEAETHTAVLDRSGAAVHGHAPRLETVAESLSRARLAHEILSGAVAESRWPALRFGGSVLFAPQGGRFRESVAIGALQRAAELQGARVTRGVTITRVRILGDELARLEVRATDRPETLAGSPAPGVPEPGEVREIECRRLVVTLGPATAKVLRGLVSLPRISAARDNGIAVPGLGGSAPAVPSVLHLPDPTAPGQGYWRGTAALIGGGGSIAIGWRDAGSAAGSAAEASARSGPLPPRELAALLRYAREWVPGADPELPTVTSRTRTAVHDGGFVIDRIGPVVVGAGFGAAGAGLAPGVGRLLAGLADGIAAPSRFALRPDRRQAFDPSGAQDSARRA